MSVYQMVIVLLLLLCCIELLYVSRATSDNVKVVNEKLAAMERKCMGYEMLQSQLANLQVEKQVSLVKLLL